MLILQCIGTCLRLGSPSDVRLERFVEAVQVPESGLTHTALVGSHKQSVEDVERLFGLALSSWRKSSIPMKQNISR